MMDTETSRVAKLLADQAEEIVNLKKQNKKLIESLQTISEWQPSIATQPRQKIIDNMQLYARLSITKQQEVSDDVSQKTSCC